MGDRRLIDRLGQGAHLTAPEWRQLLTTDDAESLAYLRDTAFEAKQPYYGNRVFIRGLIEISSYCRRNCLYCGIRRDNAHAERYRLTDDRILERVAMGYDLGFRTFVLQGGEDPAFTDARLVRLIHTIKEAYPDAAVTLSLGERSDESYRQLREAGADRYLLRHETASPEHFGRLHPKEQTWARRMRALHTLQTLGYQAGCGMMVGSPYQTVDDLAEDLMFMEAFQPKMVGMGPFIPHHDTPFKDQPAGSVDMTLRLIALIRCLLPKVLLPATTALSTMDDDGYEKGIRWGANVIMPNLTPDECREKYSLYDGKKAAGNESAEQLEDLKRRMRSIDHVIVVDRGDHPA